MTRHSPTANPEDRDETSRGAAVSSAALTGQALVLLGVLSASSARQRLLSCTWMAFAPTEVLRILFVVGHGAKRAALSGNAGFLVVNASETKSRPHIDRNRSSVTGSFTAYFKLVAFLRHAAAQPEPFVVRADDDVFISPRMLVTYAKHLQYHAASFATGGRGSHMNIYAGVFEWYSWRVNHLLATGFGYSWAMAMVQAEKSWRNFSATTDSRSAIRQNSCEDMFPLPGRMSRVVSICQGALCSAFQSRGPLARSQPIVHARCASRHPAGQGFCCWSAVRKSSWQAH